MDQHQYPGIKLGDKKRHTYPGVDIAISKALVAKNLRAMEIDQPLNKMTPEKQSTTTAVRHWLKKELIGESVRQQTTKERQTSKNPRNQNETDNEASSNN